MNIFSLPSAKTFFQMSIPLPSVCAGSTKAYPLLARATLCLCKHRSRRSDFYPICATAKPMLLGFRCQIIPRDTKWFILAVNNQCFPGKHFEKLILSWASDLDVSGIRNAARHCLALEALLASYADYLACVSGATRQHEHLVAP